MKQCHAGQCFEVLEGEAHTVPDNIRFAELAKETSTHEIKVMYGMATCPYGPIYFKYFDLTNFVDRRGNKARGVGQDFFLKKQIFKAIHTAALKVIPKTRSISCCLTGPLGTLPRTWLSFSTRSGARIIGSWLDARCQ